MKLSIGIVGLPNVGKSTLFKNLTKQEVNIANYPFATIDPNVGVVQVPDERVDKLAVLFNSKKKIPAVVEFYDIAGLVKGANKGEGLGNQFLSHIRECAAIVQVVRCFKSDEIIHIEGDTNPIRDIETINTELLLKDIETIERRLHKVEADARSGNKEFIAVRDALLEIKEKLGSGVLLCVKNYSNVLKNIGIELERELELLTAKKQIFLLNGSEEDASEELKNKIRDIGAEFIVADLGLESPIPESFDGEHLRTVEPLIQKAYKTLNLISFFTHNEEEIRAWTIEKGTKAQQAAGVIHTDFEKKFIRAEVIQWQKLLDAGGWHQVKQKGWLRLEGKEYVVQDGDVIMVRHG